MKIVDRGSSRRWQGISFYGKTKFAGFAAHGRKRSLGRRLHIPTARWKLDEHRLLCFRMEKGKGAFGTNDQPVARTKWETEDIWVRREFTLNDVDEKAPIYIKYSHDDVFELYLNGERLVSTGYTWKTTYCWNLQARQRKNCVTERT